MATGSTNEPKLYIKAFGIKVWEKSPNLIKMEPKCGRGEEKDVIHEINTH